MERATLAFEALVIALYTDKSGIVTQMLTYAPMREGKTVGGMQIECFLTPQMQGTQKRTRLAILWWERGGWRMWLKAL